MLKCEADRWIKRERESLAAVIEGVHNDALDPHHSRLAETAVMVAAHQNMTIISLLEQILLAVSKA
jgi:hypothetical protein